MKAQKRERAGNKLRDSNSQAKVLLDFKKEQAGQSIGKVQAQHQRQILNEHSELKVQKQQLGKIKPQLFQFPDLKLQSGEILRVKELKLPFGTPQPVNLALSAAEKIHIVGRNGSGKIHFTETDGPTKAATSGSNLFGTKLFLSGSKF